MIHPRHLLLRSHHNQFLPFDSCHGKLITDGHCFLSVIPFRGSNVNVIICDIHKMERQWVEIKDHHFMVSSGPFLVFSKHSFIIHRKQSCWDFCYKSCFLRISASVIKKRGALFQHQGWSTLSRHLEFEGQSRWQQGSLEEADTKEGCINTQIIGFICILNEIFWTVGLGAVEFVGNQKIPVRRERRRNDMYLSAFL